MTDSTDAPTVPGYALGPVVGRGGGAVVYAATDETTGAAVAVKVLTPAAAGDADIVRAFRRELRAGLAARHAHLVRVLGGGAFGRPQHVVMELLPGESLGERLERAGPLAPHPAVVCGRQIAAALASLHAAGFVHADVKPENVRLAAPGKAKLVDLGFAHRPGEDRALHAAGRVMGTANYLAPELCDRPPRDGFPADVFSFGVTLFETLTGVLPYPSGAVERVVLSHRDDAPADLRDYGTWHPRLPWLVGRCLERNPAARITVPELVRELTNLQIGLLRRAG